MRDTLYVITDSAGSSELQFVILGVGALIFAILAPKPLGDPKAPIPRTGLKRSERAIALLIGSVFTLVGLLSWRDAKRMNDAVYQAYTHGKCQELEGTVHLEHVQAEHGHEQGDVVKLDGETFEVDQFRFAAGYQQTVNHGGVLREGASVRVWLCNGTVARIDRVPQTGPTGPAQDHDVSP